MNGTIYLGSGKRYEVHGQLGAGGLAKVYRAYDHHLGRWVALKQLNAQDSADSALRQEAMALASLQHPNVVTLYDFQVDQDGSAFVVMELVEGETLETRLERGAMSLGEFLDFARQVLDGVGAAHVQGILHRDLKPTNIMIAPLPNGRTQIKVLDFGLARLSLAPRVQTMDQRGAMYGSIFCMAPEQFQRRPVDIRTDVYALGILFYYALAGAYPFQGDNHGAIIASHLSHAMVPLEQVRPDLPPGLCQWVMWMLNLEPDDRPRDVPECLHCLNSLDLTILVPVVRRPWWEHRLLRRVLPDTMPAWVNRWSVAVLVCAAIALPVLGALTSAPAPARPPVPAAAPAPALPPLPQDDLDATDLPALRRCLGRTVTVTGTPVLLGDSKSGNARYLNFDRDYWRALSLVFFVTERPDDFSRDSLERFLERRVRVTGTVSEHNGNLQIIVRDLAAVQPVP